MASTLFDVWENSRKRKKGEDIDEFKHKDAKVFKYVDKSIEIPVQLEKQLFEKPQIELNVVYYPHFFKAAVAWSIFNNLEEELKDYLSSPSVVKILGKVHTIPRQRAAFGDPGLSYAFSGITVDALPWTPNLLELKKCVEAATGESFNFVLVNRYKDGSQHIGEHRDDEADLYPKATIASMSFGQERDFVFKHKDSRGKDAKRKDILPVKLALAHGSLLLMKYPTNSNWYHSLPIRKKAVGCRINLTFRKMVKHK